jgi:hypothetical protein
MTDQTSGQGAPNQQDEQRRQLEQIIQGALLGPTPKYYINGIGFAQSATDLSMVLMAHNQAFAVAIMSYTAAKSLLVDLKGIIDKFEEATGGSIKTIAEINAELTQAQGQPAKRPTSSRRKPSSS